MSRASRRLRALPIRSRLALLVAAAVAFAVAAVSVTCWFIVRGKLYDEIDNDLKNSAQGGVQERTFDTLIGNCTSTPSDGTGFGPEQNSTTVYYQLVKPGGDSCVAPGAAGTVQVNARDQEVGKSEAVGNGTLRNGSDAKGNPVRVLTVPLVVDRGPQSSRVSGYALIIGTSLRNTDSTLNELALLLLLVSGIGALGAGAAGLAVARAGLRPVDRLAEAVEHVARTEDLSIRIPVEDESDDEVARLSRSFNSMTSSLANSRELQQQLIADAGHELRTPLTSLRTNIDLLTRSEETGRPIPPDDRKALLASVKAQMTELSSLIGDLQELSRSDSGPNGDKTVHVVALEDTVEAALRRARLRGPELSIRADLQPWYVMAEPTALERAIVNILDNAVKFSPEGGTIDVVLADGVLTVRDHGPGIPAEDLPHVFDRFWRSPTARALPGSGLGLSIVARTVEQAGGQVALGHADGGGTVASVRLPGAPTPPPPTPAELPAGSGAHEAP